MLGVRPKPVCRQGPEAGFGAAGGGTAQGQGAIQYPSAVYESPAGRDAGGAKSCHPSPLSIRLLPVSWLAANQCRSHVVVAVRASATPGVLQGIGPGLWFLVAPF